MDYSNYRGFNLNETVFPVKEYGFKLARHYWKGTKRHQSHQLTAGLVDDMLAENQKKQHLPSVDFKTMKEFHCVIADFDILPPQFETFANFAEFLRQAYPTACVTRSVSGKVKVIFLVSYKLHLSHKNTIKSLIHEGLHGYLDLSSTALTQTFLTPQIISDIQLWLKTAIPQEPVLKEFTEIKCEELANEYVKVCNETMELLRNAGFTTKTFRSLTEERLKKLSMLLITDALNLCNDGVIWNQEIFAKVLGLKSPKTAAKLLMHLEECGFISMICNYSVGNKSRTYAATGALRTLFESHGLHLEAQEQSTANQHKINRVISELLPPTHNANQYYLRITHTLIKLGFNPSLCMKVLFDIDQRRPKEKQRGRAYFSYLTRWTERKAA